MPWRRGDPTTAAGAGPSSSAVADALDRAEERGAQMPDALFRSVRGLVRRLRSLMARAAALPPGSVDLYVVTRMATDYLPQTVESYVRIPPALRGGPTAGGGQSPDALAREQLMLLESRLAEVEAAMNNRDQDALAAHGRFLDEKFAGSRPGPLTIPEER